MRTFQSHINSAASGRAEVRPVADSRVIVQSADLTGNCSGFLPITVWNEPFVSKMWRWGRKCIKYLKVVSNSQCGVNTFCLFQLIRALRLYFRHPHQWNMQSCATNYQQENIYNCSSFSSRLLCSRNTLHTDLQVKSCLTTSIFRMGYILTAHATLTETCLCLVRGEISHEPWF